MYEKNSNKNEIKQEKGITLIALVLTVIILLILAGVSISSIGGNRGLIKKQMMQKKIANMQN